ncbi:uncharacterized protein LOC131207204 [Anopheles bellator]|uniref:uncharacterized protein LOC131207204 n=1 Tax=Anopheles bellator TaxID=139047 RepID=UPI00264931C0|nr:uncharacterized protein LOC131207204 [Anopheles bellator]
MASRSAMVDESKDDGSEDFWSDFLTTEGIDEVMDSTSVTELYKQHVARVDATTAEDIRRINESWNIQPPTALVTTPRAPVRLGLSTSQKSTVQQPQPEETSRPGPSDPSRGKLTHLSVVARERITGAASSFASSAVPLSNKSLGRSAEEGIQAVETEQQSAPQQAILAVEQSLSNNFETNRCLSAGKRQDIGNRNGDTGDDEIQQIEKTSRRRSLYHSRSRSPSPGYRGRRRRRSRSRSRRRSRTRSRSRSRSRRSRSIESRRPKSRRDRSPYPTPGADYAMMQSMMTMMMQTMAAANASGNRMPMNFTMPPFLPQSAPTMTDPAPQSSRNIIETSRKPTTEPPENKGDATYDVGTELFLKGEINFGDYLALKPSSKENLMTWPASQVVERLQEAISILGRQETKEQTGKFLYVLPTYYDELTKKDNRSPLVWNTSNVLYDFSSIQKTMVKQCEPFSNVNDKLKQLIVKLGLDEGAVSQQIKQNALAAKAREAAEKSASRIQAITTLPARPGHSRGRHMIERAIQTEGYACSECVERTKQTFVTISTQTKPHVIRTLDAVVQTNLPEEPKASSITLDNLTPNQVEVIETIVRYIRQRQITGSVVSVSNALRRDRVASTAMGSALYQSVQETVTQAADNSNWLRGNSYQPTNNYAPQLPIHAPKPNDPRLAVRTVTRYPQLASTPQLVPAGFNTQPAVKKIKKKNMRFH